MGGTIAKRGKSYKSGKSTVFVQIGSVVHLDSKTATMEEEMAHLRKLARSFNAQERLKDAIESARRKAETATDPDRRRLLEAAMWQAENCLMYLEQGKAPEAVLHALIMAEDLRDAEMVRLIPAIATDHMVRKGGRDVQAKAKAHGRELAEKRQAIAKAAAKDAGPVRGRTKRIARAAGCSWTYAKRVLAEIDTTAPVV